MQPVDQGWWRRACSNFALPEAPKPTMPPISSWPYSCTLSCPPTSAIHRCFSWQILRGSLQKKRRSGILAKKIPLHWTALCFCSRNKPSLSLHWGDEIRNAAFSPFTSKSSKCLPRLPDGVSRQGLCTCSFGINHLLIILLPLSENDPQEGIGFSPFLPYIQQCCKLHLEFVSLSLLLLLLLSHRSPLIGDLSHISHYKAPKTTKSHNTVGRWRFWKLGRWGSRRFFFFPDAWYCLFQGDVHFFDQYRTFRWWPQPAIPCPQLGEGKAFS